MIRPDLMAQQWASTERAPLAMAVMLPQRTPETRTSPAVFDSPPPAPPKPTRCRGASCRQGRADCKTPNRCRADNTDDGYRSRPVPLSAERPSRRMLGEALGNVVGFPAAIVMVVVAVAALVHCVAR